MTAEVAEMPKPEVVAPRGTTVIEALALVMDEVRSVGKGDFNEQNQYNFRGVDAVVNAVGPALRKHGVVVIPTVTETSYQTVEVGHKRTQMGQVLLRVRYRFYGPQGDYIDAEAPGEAFDSGDKSTAKAMSVAFRTCLLQALCLPTTEADPDHMTYERAPKPSDEEIQKWADGISARVQEETESDRLRELWLEVVNHPHAPRAMKEEMKTELIARSKELGHE